MAQIKYQCNQCSKDFTVKYVLIKPGQITCPHCGSASVKQVHNAGCECGSNRKGFFT